jgi:hypothetical protein
MILMARQEMPEWMYIDQESKPRSKFLEYMFEDLYHDRPLGELFRENFETYCGQFFDIFYVPQEIYSEYETALRFVSEFGMVSITPFDNGEWNDPDFSHCNYQSEIQLKPKYAEPYGIKTKCQPTVAPTMHAAVLIAFVQLMREITVAHIENGEKGN